MKTRVDVEKVPVARTAGRAALVLGGSGAAPLPPGQHQDHQQLCDVQELAGYSGWVPAGREDAEQLNNVTRKQLTSAPCAC